MTDYGHNVPAPLFRKSFSCGEKPESAILTISGLGYYRVFVNGTERTAGLLAPYTSNPDLFTYFNRYDITDDLKKGENVIGVILGNGIRNCIGGKNWKFDQATFRGAPLLAMKAELTYPDGTAESFEADDSFRVHRSPILFDDLRLGEIYDARLEDEIDGWMMPGFDDSSWDVPVFCDMPRGEQRIVGAPPVVARRVLRPVKIYPEDDAYIFDFGQNGAGVLTICDCFEAGRTIRVEFGEYLKEGKFNNSSIHICGKENNAPFSWQTIEYTSAGKKGSRYTQSFSYFGFRYAKVTGITADEATEELLTYTQMSSKLNKNGDFSCSDEIANRLQKMTIESDLSNLFHIPTDCPHREKNGWTGDAALSAVQMLYNFDVDELFIEWMRNVAATQDYKGALPGIVPTSGWGYYEWNGPAWEAVMVEIPYRLYQLRGDLRCAEMMHPAMMKYVAYALSRRDEKGLCHYGLFDWEPPHFSRRAPLEVTDTIYCYDFAKKAAALYHVMKMEEVAHFCEEAAEGYRNAIRTHLIDFDTCTVYGSCQTSQAMAIYYGIFNDDEKEKALAKLVELIEAENRHIDCGVLGARVIFRVLSDAGMVDLAYEMICQPDAPSYAEWLTRGDTTLAEDFYAEEDQVNSRNHHFLGDISAWFMDSILGIRINPDLDNPNRVDVRPNLPKVMDFAEGYITVPAGKVCVKLTRHRRSYGDFIVADFEVPDGVTGTVYPQSGNWNMGCPEFPLRTGSYETHPLL